MTSKVTELAGRIVHRLRNEQPCCLLQDEAADVIEDLRGRNRQLIDWVEKLQRMYADVTSKWQAEMVMCENLRSDLQNERISGAQVAHEQRLMLEGEVERLRAALDLSEEYNRQKDEQIERLRAHCDKLAAGLPEGMLPADVENLRASNAEMATEIERMRKFELHLSGCVNVLADKLSQHTGKTVPTEITEAESVLDALSECRRLLREAVDQWDSGHPHYPDGAVRMWKWTPLSTDWLEAAQAAGGE